MQAIPVIKKPFHLANELIFDSLNALNSLYLFGGLLETIHQIPPVNCMYGIKIKVQAQDRTRWELSGHFVFTQSDHCDNYVMY